MECVPRLEHVWCCLKCMYWTTDGYLVSSGNSTPCYGHQDGGWWSLPARGNSYQLEDILEQITKHCGYRLQKAHVVQVTYLFSRILCQLEFWGTLLTSTLSVYKGRCRAMACTWAMPRKLTVVNWNPHRCRILCFVPDHLATSCCSGTLVPLNSIVACLLN